MLSNGFIWGEKWIKNTIIFCGYALKYTWNRYKTKHKNTHCTRDIKTITHNIRKTGKKSEENEAEENGTTANSMR